MSLSAAQAAANDLRTALLDNGVRQVSLELQPGVSSSGWGVAPFKRGLGHHIASRPSQGRTPGLALVKAGRADLRGPLCNGYGGYDLVARIITMGWANHPGAGGPWSVPGWGTVPKDDGRPRIFGWEFEGGYEPYTDEMHDFMACCGAGTLDWLGTLDWNPGPAPLECWDEHKGWAPGRKPDRIGYTTASGRARIAAVRQGDDDMSAEAERKIDEILNRLRGPADERGYDLLQGIDSMVADVQARVRGGHPEMDSLQVIQWMLQQVGAPDIDEEKLAAALAPSLVPAVLGALPSSAGLTEDDVKNAIRDVLRSIPSSAG